MTEHEWPEAVLQRHEDSMEARKLSEDNRWYSHIKRHERWEQRVTQLWWLVTTLALLFGVHAAHHAGWL
jgi:hypothetical protein